MKNRFIKFIKNKITIIKNKKLIKKYPFVAIKNIDNDIINYKYTWIDYVADGWRKAFIFDFLDEIKAQLEKEGKESLEQYTFYDIKEKYGSLRISSRNASAAIVNIENYYESYSEFVCQQCGKPAEYSSRGWITFLCKKCVEKNHKENYKRSVKYAKKNNKEKPVFVPVNYEKDYFKESLNNIIDNLGEAPLSYHVNGRDITEERPFKMKKYHFLAKYYLPKEVFNE